MTPTRRHDMRSVTTTAGLVLFVALIVQAPAAAAPRDATVEVGPGRVVTSLHGAARRVKLGIAPNRATARNTITLAVTRNGTPVHRARVTVAFTMQDMTMGTHTFRLNESRKGVYSYSGPALVMAGSWFLEFAVTPERGKRFKVSVLDHIET
jgi:hypothetical protein